MGKIIDIEELEKKHEKNLWIFDKKRALTVAEVESLSPINIHECFFNMLTPMYDNYVDEIVDMVLGNSKEVDDLNNTVAIDFVRLCIGETLRIDENESVEALESRIPDYMKKKARELKRKEVKKLSKEGFNMRQIAGYQHTPTMVTGLRPILKLLFTQAEIKKIEKEKFGVAKDFIRYISQLTFGMVESQTKN